LLDLRPALAFLVRDLPVTTRSVALGVTRARIRLSRLRRLRGTADDLSAVGLEELVGVSGVVFTSRSCEVSGAQFEVQVRSGSDSRVARQSDKVASLELLAHFDLGSGHVSVRVPESLAVPLVLDDDVVAVAGHPAVERDLAVEHRRKLRARRHTVVGSSVELAPAVLPVRSLRVIALRLDEFAGRLGAA